MASKQYWLMKSEPEVYSMADLERDGTAPWEGVRNYQARHFLRDTMKKGDMVLFYHSSTKPMGVAGVAQVCREGYPDCTAWDPQSAYFDPKASPDNPIWFMVDVAFVERFSHVVTREQLRAEESLREMMVLKRGARLSIQPVVRAHFERVRQLGRRKAG